MTMPAPSGLPRAEEIAAVVQRFQRILQAIDTYSKYSLRRYGVTGPQLWAMGTLRGAGVLTVGELASRMYLHISTISSLVDRLEHCGYVERRRDARDGRVVRLRLTRQGAAVLRRAPAPPRARLARGLEQLGLADLRHLSRALEKLSRITQVEEIEAMLAREQKAPDRHRKRRLAGGRQARGDRP